MVRDSDPNLQEGAPPGSAQEEEIVLTNKDGWQKVKGRFIAINSFAIACKCALAPSGTSPCSHLGDGCVDVVVIKECSRVEYAKHLVRCMDRSADQVSLSSGGWSSVG